MKHIPQDEKKYLEIERNDFIQPGRGVGSGSGSVNVKGEAIDEGPSMAEILEKAAARGDATVDHDCSKCTFPMAKYDAIQMRSADEGQTIFYTCLKCGHREKDANS